MKFIEEVKLLVNHGMQVAANSLINNPSDSEVDDLDLTIEQLQAAIELLEQNGMEEAVIQLEIEVQGLWEGYMESREDDPETGEL